MPFRKFEWVDDGRLSVGASAPDPELRQTDAKSFLLLKSFCYVVPPRRPHAGTVFVVPGVDMARSDETRRTVTVDVPPCPVVVPPNDCGRTDLASVPWFMSWLVASYGNHTLAALLHDALYVDCDNPPVSRREADRLLLHALREPGQAKGTFRHWLMWVAVSAFGAMRWYGGVVFAAHALAVWVLAVWAALEAWGGGLSWTLAHVALLAAAVVGGLVLLGTSWRALVDIRWGWLLPTVLIGGVLLGLLVLAWERPVELEASPVVMLACAFALFVLGFAWSPAVDPTLAGWLWPTAIVGVPVVAPVVLIAPVVAGVWLLDLGAALAAAPRKDPETGETRGIKLPTFEPFRARL